MWCAVYGVRIRHSKQALAGTISPVFRVTRCPVCRRLLSDRDLPARPPWLLGAPRSPSRPGGREEIGGNLTDDRHESSVRDAIRHCGWTMDALVNKSRPQAVSTIVGGAPTRKPTPQSERVPTLHSVSDRSVPPDPTGPRTTARRPGAEGCNVLTYFERPLHTVHVHVREAGC